MNKVGIEFVHRNDLPSSLMEISGLSTEEPIRIDGSLRDEEHIFDAFSSALAFPDYCGRNWNAFEECIRDLSWLSPKRQIVLILSDEAGLLSLQNETWTLLLDVLSSASKEWAKAHIDFRVLLVGTEKLGARLDATGEQL